ncbi:MAG: hypothetical protein JW997_01570, partial [Actinobacteria bacterium]|nr:hypothetical protein [Actinomycetota bacterium]
YISIFIIIAFIPAGITFMQACSGPTASFDEIVISEDIIEDSKEPVKAGSEFNINVKRIIATVRYSGVKGSERWGFKWINTDLDKIIIESSEYFSKASLDDYFQGTVSSDIFINDQAKIIAPGSYRVEFYYNGELLKTAAFKIIKPSSGIIEVSLSEEIDVSGKPLKPSAKFLPYSIVYLSAKLDYAIAGNILKTVWKNPSGEVFEELELDIKSDYYDSSYIWFALPLRDKKYEIKPGFYEVDIMLNDVLFETLEFEVQKLEAPVFSANSFYENEKFGFTVAIPDEWAFDEEMQEEAVFITLDPQINISATFIIAALKSAPIKPYEEFIDSDVKKTEEDKNWTFAESRKREYLLGDKYQTLEKIYLFKDKNDKSCIAVYSITEYNGYALICHIIIEDETYKDFAESSYQLLINSLTFITE